MQNEHIVRRGVGEKRGDQPVPYHSHLHDILSLGKLSIESSSFTYLDNVNLIFHFYSLAVPLHFTALFESQLRPVKTETGTLCCDGVPLKPLAAVSIPPLLCRPLLIFVR